MTEEGYYVGVQHPMVLIIRKRDMKLISCSKKKIAVYESAYIGPLSYSPTTLDAEIKECEHTADEESMFQNLAKATDKFGAAETTHPSHVQSIKSMSSHTVPVPNTSAPQMMRPQTTLDASADSQNPDQGEGFVVPEHIT
jgi:hypothetical protein